MYSYGHRSAKNHCSTLGIKVQPNASLQCYQHNEPNVLFQTNIISQHVAAYEKRTLY